MIAARQYSRPVAQNHQTLRIIFNGGFVECARSSKIVVPHEYSLDAGLLAAIAEQFNGVLASHAIILAEAMLRVYPAEKPIAAR
ncbi:MAG: hypothetical protein WBG18_21825, partial [Xanthobacteraceae bacterium]